MSTPIERFATRILGKPLYPYQALIANAILDSITRGDGAIFTVMMARQSGKNQLSAVLEAFLLAFHTEGKIIKAAPTFSPQIINSRVRLMSMLDNHFLSNRIWTSYSTIGLAPGGQRKQVQRHAGPSVTFFSAEPTSNVVGATASLLLEMDEAQDIEQDKFDREFRPMASTTNATTVMYGTAWSHDTLFAGQIVKNLEQQARTGKVTHFAFDWTELAAINSNYKRFVTEEIARLGNDHPAIRTQYLLQTINGEGRFLTSLQQRMLQGTHGWIDTPQEDEVYVMGFDVAGEDRTQTQPASHHAQQHSSSRDSSVITIARIVHTELNMSKAEIVHHVWWTGKNYTEQYAETSALIEQWNIRTCVIDKTGLGAWLASLLLDRF
jgi:hypothetical protein